ncbi:hypothetical protein [Novosphingobium sp. JCM 18896]|uniref:hypothetical protein n=1 Tax=Novosphingobium sp. JCM 18896 TaxID=2989731 RepID=UPI0022228CBD|nr:hypothetical protein [Novosphingobium sp. JCM 18896]MCW1429507.1 hypothetical protein [Novosphingobium sp. JCM 18896]
MRKFLVAATAALFVAGAPAVVVAQAPAAAVASQGKMIYTSTGQRLAPVYRVTGTGDAQIIHNGKLVTIPASTLSDVDGKLTTSLSRKEVGQAR